MFQKYSFIKNKAEIAGGGWGWKNRNLELSLQGPKLETLGNKRPASL